MLLPFFLALSHILPAAHFQTLAGNIFLWCRQSKFLVAFKVERRWRSLRTSAKQSLALIHQIRAR